MCSKGTAPDHYILLPWSRTTKTQENRTKTFFSSPSTLSTHLKTPASHKTVLATPLEQVITAQLADAAAKIECVEEGTFSAAISYAQMAKAVIETDSDADSRLSVQDSDSEIAEATMEIDMDDASYVAEQRSFSTGRCATRARIKQTSKRIWTDTWIMLLLLTAVHILIPVLPEQLDPYRILQDK